MENNNLKEKIRKNVKERIAVSNIREEFDMKMTNKRKIIYGTLSVCAMCVLCFGVVLSTEKGNNKLLSNIRDESVQTKSGIDDLKTDKDKQESDFNNNEQITNKTVEDKDTGENEPVKELTNNTYPKSYGGRYVDNNGNNVVWICEDSSTNRKEICKFLGITESKTTFKTAKYSYNYLTELQNKISQKMIDKEFTFVITLAIMDTTNNIKVTVTSNRDEDVKRLKELDTIGGAIEIQYNENGMSKTELLVEKK